MPRPIVTPETRRDLQILQMRSYLDPTQHFRRDDVQRSLPEFFQVGTVISGPADFYSKRIPRSERVAHEVDALLADAHFKARTKKSFKEIQEKAASGGKLAYQEKQKQKRPRNPYKGT